MYPHRVMPYGAACTSVDRMPQTVTRRSSGSRSSSVDPLLTLRTDVPRPPGRHVERPRLTTLLEQGADRPLTLVSAPAGSGKTSLLAAWVARRASPGTVA